MKYLLTILLFIAFNAKSQYFIDAKGAISASGSYPVNYAAQSVGRNIIVYDILGRNSIGKAYRDTSTTLVYTRIDSSFWVLKGGIEDSNFVKIATSGSGGIAIDTTKIAYLAKNQTFTGLNTFASNTYFNSSVQIGNPNFILSDNYATIPNIIVARGLYIPSDTDRNITDPVVIGYPQISCISKLYGTNRPFYIPQSGSTAGVQAFAFLSDITAASYTAGFGLNLSAYQFKADTTKLLPINDSGYRYITPYQLTTKEPIITPSNSANKYWNGYKQFVPFSTDSIPQGTTNKYFVTGDTLGLSNKVNYSDSTVKYVTPTQLANKNYLTAASISGKVNVSDSNIVYATPSKVKRDSLALATSSNAKLNIVDSVTKYVTPTYFNANKGINLTALSATRNSLTGSIFTYNSSTGAYNFDTTQLQKLTAGSNVTIVANAINADTTTGATKLATQGYVLRNSGTLTANAPISIVSNVIKADTTSRYGGLATIGKTYNDSLMLANKLLNMLDTTLSRQPYTFIGRKAGTGIWSQMQYMDSTWWNGLFATQVRAAQNGGLSGLTSGQLMVANSSSTITGYAGLTFNNSTNVLTTTGDATINGVSVGLIGSANGSSMGIGRAASIAGGTANGQSVVIGYASSISSNNYNTTLGASTSIPSGANSTAIGYGATVNVSNTIQLGNTSVTNVNTSGSITCNKINIATGANASVGTATLSSGTVTVNTTAVTANSIIMLTGQSCSTCGHVYISAKTASTSFVITSTNTSDASVIAWQIIN